MTTTEFIKYIKACNEGRKRQLPAKLVSKAYIITESELEKIEKVNVELLEALIKLHDQFLNVVNDDVANNKYPAYDLAFKTIKNASNIKQI